MGSGNTTNLTSTIVPKPCSHCSQISGSDSGYLKTSVKNCRHLEPLSIHQKKAVSELLRSITIDCCKTLLIRKLHVHIFKIFPVNILIDRELKAHTRAD